jgi:hypothetical protein
LSTGYYVPVESLCSVDSRCNSCGAPIDFAVLDEELQDPCMLKLCAREHVSNYHGSCLNTQQQQKRNDLATTARFVRRKKMLREESKIGNNTYCNDLFGE